MAKIKSFAPISELHSKDFMGELIDNAFTFATRDNKSLSIRLQDVFDWIKEESIKNGLTVELKNNQIMFISGQKTEEP